MAERDWFATAFVRIKPDPTGFRKQLREDVRKSVSSAGVFKVPVQFDLQAFKRKLQNEARQAKVRVPVEPDVTKFRKQLLSRLKTATAGVTVKVPVQVAAARAAGTAGGTGAPRQTEEEKELARVQKLRTDVQNRLTVSQQKLTAATDKDLGAKDRQNRLVKLGNQLGGVDDKVTRELAAARNAGKNAIVQELEPLQAKIQALRTEVTTQADAAAVEARTKPLKEATNKATERSAKLLSVEVGALATRAELAELNNNLLSLEKTARANVQKAQAANLTGLEAENAALLQNSAARRREIADRLKTIAAEGAHATQLKNLSRGAGATGLSFLGLRGATLAAGAEFLAGAAAIAAFTKALSSAAELERELNVFRATTEATGTEMERVRELALDLGRDITLPGVAAQDAATAMTELAKAGFTVEESMDGARGVLQLATAAQLENAQAAELAANALNAFGLGGENAVRVADLLANSANLSQGSIEDMGIALRQSAAAARQAGLTLRDTVAILTILARNGLRGSDAGTALRTALIRLINPSKKAAKEIEKLNIQVRDSQGNIRPQVFSDIAQATKDLTRAEQDRTAAIIFGQDAFRTQSILGREGVKVFNDMAQAVDRAGAAQELARARTTGFAGQVEALKNNLATLGTTIGDVAKGPVQLFVKSLNDSVSAVNDLIKVAGFFSQFSPLTSNTKEAEKFRSVLGKIINLTSGGPMISAAKQWKFFFDTFGLGADKLDNASEAAEGVSKILKTLETAGGGPTAINTAVLALQDMVSELEEGSPASQRLARDVQKVIDQLQQFRGFEIPEKFTVDVAFPTADIAGEVSDLASSIDFTRDKFGELGQDGGILALRIEDVFQRIEKAGSDPVALKTLAAQLQNLKANLDKSDPSQVTFANRLQSIIDRILALSALKIPNFDLPELTLPRSLQSGETGKLIAKNIKDPLRRALIGQPMYDMGFGALDSFVQGAKARAKTGGPEVARVFTTSLDTQITVAEAKGQDDVVFAKLQQQLERRQGFLSRLLARQGEKRTPKEQKAFDDLLQQAAENVSETAGRIESIQDERASRAEQAKDDITAAREKADDRVLKALTAAESKLETRLLIASGTKRLGDDIRVTKLLVALYKKQIVQARKQLKDAETRNKVVGDLIDKRIKAEQDLEDLKEQREQDLAEARQEKLDRRRESLSLDIEIAQAEENLPKEIKARSAEIRFLAAQVRAAKKGSLERKRLLAELRNAQKELRDLTAEKKKTNNEFKQLAFAFLQSQQGFAANLIGNLIPGDMLGGLVGGAAGTGRAGARAGQPLGKGARTTQRDAGAIPGLRGFGGMAAATAVREQRAVEDVAGRVRGVTSGQGNVQIDLLRKIWFEVRKSNRSTDHPEARQQRKTGAAALDYGGGGQNMGM